MTKAEAMRQYALSLVGQKYSLGNEPWYDVGDEPSPDPLATDCSGLVYAVYRRAGVLYKGKPLARLTADDYWRLATKISKPEFVGNCCWFPRTGRKTHMAVYIGGGETIEAGYHGPGNAYPGHGYVGTCTVAQMNARGAVWGRLEGLDIYEEAVMTDDDRRLLQEAVVLGRQARVSDLARSHDMEILKAMIAGETQSVIDGLEAQKAKAVRAARRELGLSAE